MPEVVLPIHVTPKSSCNKIIGWKNEELKIKIAAQPEKGEANQELIAFLSKAFSVKKSDIDIIRGTESRHKLVRIKGMTFEEVNKAIKV